MFAPHLWSHFIVVVVFVIVVVSAEFVTRFSHIPDLVQDFSTLNNNIVIDQLNLNMKCGALIRIIF